VVVSYPEVIPFQLSDTSGHTGLQPQMMSQLPAAPELLNKLVCNCPPDAYPDECSCLENGQPCTAACICKASLDGEDGVCANPLTVSVFYNNIVRSNNKKTTSVPYLKYGQLHIPDRRTLKCLYHTTTINLPNYSRVIKARMNC